MIACASWVTFAQVMVYMIVLFVMGFGGLWAILRWLDRR